MLDYATRGFAERQVNEISNVELLDGHLEPVERWIDLELSAVERAAVREIRAKNLDDMAAHALLRRANVLAGSRPLKEIVALLSEAVERNPESFAANRMFADALMQQRRFEPARAHYAAAVRIRQDDLRARRGLAAALQGLGRVD